MLLEFLEGKVTYRVARAA